ncbi:MAG: nonstructural protein [Microvirus sp.]|nr:MAG: nonstructural protein [Microvirus sp.]
MKLELFSIRDGKAQVFNMPFFAASIAVGERHFMALKKDPLSIVHQFPDDFRLYRLGWWDDHDSGFSLFDEPQLLEI